MDVQTEPVFIKSKDCETSRDDQNEYFGVAVSVKTEKQESKCRDCSDSDIEGSHNSQEGYTSRKGKKLQKVCC